MEYWNTGTSAARVIFFFGGWEYRRTGTRKQADRTTSLVRMNPMMHLPERRPQAGENKWVRSRKLARYGKLRLLERRIATSTADGVISGYR
jgi:hypothetical protein